MCGVCHMKRKRKNINLCQLFTGKNYVSKYSGTTIFRGTKSSHFNDENILKM
jgi:hypothetical protein